VKFSLDLKFESILESYEKLRFTAECNSPCVKFTKGLVETQWKSSF